jgi:hypothetical protein
MSKCKRLYDNITVTSKYIGSASNMRKPYEKPLLKVLIQGDYFKWTQSLVIFRRGAYVIPVYQE